MQEKSILEMAGGAFLERADYEMGKILKNISDINTNATKKRVLTIQLEFTPDEERENISIKATVKSKLEPTNPVRTTLYSTVDQDGQILMAEMVPQVPGQYGMDGSVQEKPAILKIVRGA